MPRHSGIELAGAGTDDDDARLIYLLDWLEPQGYDGERIFRDHAYARQPVLTRVAARTGL